MPFKSDLLDSFQIAFNKRKPLENITNALRLVNGQGDGLDGLVIERYDKHFVAQVFDSCWLKETQTLKDLLNSSFKVDFLIIKDRTQSALSNPEDFQTKVLVENTSSKTVIIENGLKFEVDLNDTLNTGLFLDMRANRLRVAQACEAKKVLNCFAYTCSFGVYAKAKGAREVVNVDVSQKILERGRRNYQLNNLEAARNELIKADASLYLEIAAKKGNCFDVIILDPPSFSRAGDKVFSVQKHLPQLIRSAIAILNEQGQVFVATNFSEISNPLLVEIFKKASGKKAPKKITQLGQDQDFLGSGKSKESHLAALWVEY